MSARGGLEAQDAGIVRDVQEESGSGTDLAWRHDTQRETPRHDRACRATTPKNMTARASDGTPARHGVVALVVHGHCRDTSVAGVGRRNAHTELSLSRGCLGVDTAGFAAVVIVIAENTTRQTGPLPR